MAFGEGQAFPVGLGWEGGPKQDEQLLADRCTPNACNGGGACGLDAGVAECRCTAGYEGAA